MDLTHIHGLQTMIITRLLQQANDKYAEPKIKKNIILEQRSWLRCFCHSVAWLGSCNISRSPTGWHWFCILYQWLLHRLTELKQHKTTIQYNYFITGTLIFYVVLSMCLFTPCAQKNSQQFEKGHPKI